MCFSSNINAKTMNERFVFYLSFSCVASQFISGIILGFMCNVPSILAISVSQVCWGMLPPIFFIPLFLYWFLNGYLSAKSHRHSDAIFFVVFVTIYHIGLLITLSLSLERGFSHANFEDDIINYPVAFFLYLTYYCIVNGVIWNIVLRRSAESSNHFISIYHWWILFSVVSLLFGSLICTLWFGS